MKDHKWKVWFDYRDNYGYHSEFKIFDAKEIGGAIEAAYEWLREKSEQHKWDAYMITDVGLMGDPDSEVC